MEGSERNCQDTEDTTTLVQFEETKSDSRKLSYVTKLSPVPAVNGMGPGWQVSFSCTRFQEYDRCPKKQETVVRLSRVHPTELTCFQELIKRLQDRHVEYVETLAKKGSVDVTSVPTVSPDAPNVLEEMMQFRQVKSRAEVANKIALEEEV
jgi:hypothetical protein